MLKKLLFYQQYGVEEYYIYELNEVEFIGLIRVENRLEEIEETNGWVSPRLGIKFVLTSGTLEIFRPDGQRFFTSVELDRLREQECQRAEEERQRADREYQRAEKLAAKLRELGIDPDLVD